MKTEHAEAVIELVQKISAAFETTMTEEELAAQRNRERDDDTSSALVYSVEQRQAAFEEFATLGAMEALETMADEIHNVVDERMRKLYGDCLAVYYALEDLAAKDPENETYIHHMHEMETAHLSQYGRPIPPRA